MTANRRTPHARILLIAGAVIALIALLLLPLRKPSARSLLIEMRPGLELLRDSAESCRDALNHEQTAFRDLGDRVDSLRSRIAALEALHPDGVPADSYRVYLSIVDSFNAVVPEWEPVAATVADRRAACEDVVRRHNERADSARVLVDQVRAEEGSSGRLP
ncbi:MAG: hypothetical protein L0271_25400 [Gemmatimonadetes bacterium]|nr:hypothetical protein [Gemmatimonadota bacterium]